MEGLQGCPDVVKFNLLCMEGAAGIAYPGGVEQIKKGETILIPAELKNLAILPTEATTLLEVYIK